MPIKMLWKDGKSYALSQFVKITTKDGKCVEGKIGCISNNAVDILPDKTIFLKDIRFITAAAC